MSNASANVTWQKVAILATILLVIVPTILRAAWQIVFPSDYLVYRVEGPVIHDEYVAGRVIVYNAGQDIQRGIRASIELPASIDLKKVYVGVGSSERFIYNSVPNGMKLLDVKDRNKIDIDLEDLKAEESISIAIFSYGKYVNKNSFLVPSWVSPEITITSNNTKAVEGDSIPSPEFDTSARGFYYDIAPYFLAFLVAALSAVIFISILYTLFFDSLESQMAKHWREMDRLQEIMDKERRYKIKDDE